MKKKIKSGLLVSRGFIFSKLLAAATKDREINTPEDWRLVAQLIHGDMKTYWRKGQTYFNVLEALKPNMANKLRALGSDPFYWSDEQSLAPFFEWVYTNWE